MRLVPTNRLIYHTSGIHEEITGGRGPFAGGARRFSVHFGKSAAEFLCTSRSAGGHTFLAFAAASVL